MRRVRSDVVVVVTFQPATVRCLPLSASSPSQQNFQRLLQLTHVTNVVIGSSAERVCSW